MQELITCPVCTLYLRPGMTLEDHLETHPKEQVIKALVSLAINPSRTQHQDFSSAAACGNYNDHTNPGGYNHQPPPTQCIFTPPPPPRPNVMIVNRQSTMVYHASSAVANREQPPPPQRVVQQPNFIAPSQLQIFALSHQNPTNTTPQRLPPPPAYGTAINHLRSQQNQSQIGFHTQLSSPSPSHRNSPHSRLSFNQTPPVSTSNFLPTPRSSPRPPPSPSVLRYAESPISAHYVERENGDFIVQESPRHVVECVETENGEFSVIEKVIQSPPSVVQFHECDNDNDKEYVTNDQYCEAQEEEPPTTPSPKLDEESSEEHIDEIQATTSKGGGVKDVTVLSNVKLDPNESLEIMENLESMKSGARGELLWTGLADIKREVESRIEITGKSRNDAKDVEVDKVQLQASTSSSMSTATSVIRLASNKTTASHNSAEDAQISEQFPTKHSKDSRTIQSAKRPFKKQPKKLTVKFKVAIPGVETFSSEKDIAATETGTKSAAVFEQETQVQSSNLVVELATTKCNKSQEAYEGLPKAQTADDSAHMPPQECELISAPPLDTSDNAIDVDNSLIMIPKQETDSTTTDMNLEAAQPMIVHEPSLSREPNTEYQDGFSLNGHLGELTSRIQLSQCQAPSLQVEQMTEMSRQRIEFSKLLDKVCSDAASRIDHSTVLSSSDSTMKSVSSNENEKNIDEMCNNDAMNFTLSACSEDIDSSNINSTFATSPPSNKASTSTSFSLESEKAVYSAKKEEEKQEQTDVEQSSEFNSDYPFGLLYGGTNSAEAQPWSRYVTPQQMSQFQEMDNEQSNYMDLDTYKITSCQISGIPNIHTDEKMPAKGEISEQESNGDVENSWSNPHYAMNGFRITNSYEAFRSDWMENTDGVMPFSQDFVSEFKTDPTEQTTNTLATGIKNEEPSGAPKETTIASSLLSRKIEKSLSYSRRLKQFQCTHCTHHFPLLKERNAHLIEVHGYKRVNRRLIREAPSCTITTENLAASVVGTHLPSQLDNNVTITASILTDPAADDVKPDIKPEITVTSTPIEATVFPRTKYDSIRAEVYRMLMHFNLNVLKSRNIAVDETFFESKSFCCFTCKRSFISVKLYDEHLAEHPAECFTCGRKFTRWNYLSLHLKRHIGWKDFACTVCEKKFVIRSALVEHMRMHTGIAPLKCKMCDKTFKRYSNLTQHKKTCHGTKYTKKKDYVCYCGEVVPSKARFLWHKETHETKPKVCPYCRDRFVHRRSLKRHIRLTHSDKFEYVQPVKCKECKQVYAKASMKAHMLTHSIVTQYECSICNKSFTTKWNLKIHSWVHANRTAKPFKCEHCIKAFVREVDYKNHINSHKNIKPYTCEFCGCKFIRKYNYMRHRKEHTAQKRFKCDLCGKTFHRNYYLIEHRRMHTGERPFLCTICGKSSTTKTNHNKHLKIHHSRDPFTAES